MSAESIKTAYIFPGQGTQGVGMADSLLNYPDPEVSVIAKRTFKQASDVLGFDLQDMCQQGPEDALNSPGNTEPAILVTSIAALRFLQHFDNYPDFENDIVAGLSLGEYSALVAAEAITFDKAVELVKARGEYMAEANEINPGRMAAVRGLDLGDIEKVCTRFGVEVANILTENETVISGREDLLSLAIEEIRRNKKKAMLLNVHIASHSSLMDPAKDEMQILLEKTDIQEPKMDFIQNTTADYARTVNEVRRGMIDQITGRVNWLDTVRLMQRDGVGEYIEVGPGEVLTKLMRRIDSDADAKSWIHKIPDLARV